MQRGPRAARGETAELILNQARESFAENGYAATTLRQIALAAGVDTRLVSYYFRDKPTLFDACLAFPEQLIQHIRASVDVPLSERGEAVLRAMLSAWAHPDLARVMRTSLLIAAHEPAAMARVRMVFADGLIPAISEGLEPDEISTRGGLISSQMVGLAFTRFVFALDATAAIPDHQLITHVGATIQRYLTEPLVQPDQPRRGISRRKPKSQHVRT